MRIDLPPASARVATEGGAMGDGYRRALEALVRRVGNPDVLTITATDTSVTFRLKSVAITLDGSGGSLNITVADNENATVVSAPLS